MKFSEALKDGKSSEKIVLKLLQNTYPSADRIIGYNKEFDIVVPEANMTIEVKKDFKSQETGNVVIETSMNNNPSGITTTGANWWVFHTDPNKLIWITTFIIRYMIEIEGFKEVEFIGKGDTKKKKAYLVPIEILELYAKRVQAI